MKYADVMTRVAHESAYVSTQIKKAESIITAIREAFDSDSPEDSEYSTCALGDGEIGFSVLLPDDSAVVDVTFDDEQFMVVDPQDNHMPAFVRL